MDPYYMAQQHGQPTDPATAAAKAAAAAAAAAAAHAAAAEAAGAALPFQMPHMPPGAPAYMHWPQQPMGLQPRAPPPPHMWNPYACMMPPAPVVSAPPYTALAGLTIPTRTRCSEREDASGRWVLEPEDVLLLERVFALEKCPGRELRAQLAARLHVKPRQIQVWFQNKRQRTKNGAKPTVAEALAHAVYSAEHRTQKEPAELLMNMAAGGAAETAGAVSGAGGSAASTAAALITTAANGGGSDAGSGNSPGGTRMSHSNAHGTMSIPTQEAASNAAATAEALVAATSHGDSRSTAAAALAAATASLPPPAGSAQSPNGVTTAPANGSAAAENGQETTVKRQGSDDSNGVAAPSEGAVVDASKGLLAGTQARPTGSNGKPPSSPDSPQPIPSTNGLSAADAAILAAAEAPMNAPPPSMPPIAAPAPSCAAPAYAAGVPPMMPPGVAAPPPGMTAVPPGAMPNGGTGPYPDGFTDGQMLWVRSDILMMRPELLSAEANPIFVPGGQPPPEQAQGDAAQPGMPPAGALPHPVGAPAAPLSGVPLVRSTTQEACASAMLALSGGAAPSESSAQGNGTGAAGGAVPAPVEEGDVQMPTASEAASYPVEDTVKDE